MVAPPSVAVSGVLALRHNGFRARDFCGSLLNSASARRFSAICAHLSWCSTSLTFVGTVAPQSHLNNMKTKYRCEYNEGGNKTRHRTLSIFASRRTKIEDIQAETTQLAKSAFAVDYHDWWTLRERNRNSLYGLNMQYSKRITRCRMHCTTRQTMLQRCMTKTLFCTPSHTHVEAEESFIQR